MASAQRRIGPNNIGYYGVITSIINGCNLILTQVIILKQQLNYWFQLMPILFGIITFLNYGIIVPFLSFSAIFIIIESIILSAYSSINKYSLLGSVDLLC